jgi:hypothetical protein
MRLVPLPRCKAADIDELLSRNWVHRAWTLQELILSWNPVIVCGTKLLPWQDFLHGMLFINDPHNDVRINPTWQEKQLYQPFMEDACAFPNSLRHWGPLVTLWLRCPRPTHWNGLKVRKVLSKPATAEAYLEERKRWPHTSYYTILQFLIYLTAALPRYTVFLIPLGLFIHTLASVVTEKSDIDWIIPKLFFSATLTSISIVYFFFTDTTFTTLCGLCCYDKDQADLEKRRKIYHADNTSSSTTIQGIVQAIRERACYDNKDRSYAYYGVLSIAGVPLAPADYAKSEGDILRELVTDLLNWDPKWIRLLPDTGGRLLHFDQPSWVPDLSSAGGIVSRGDGGHDQWFDARHCYGTQPESATPGSTPYARIQGNHREQLAIKFRKHGNVIFVTRRFIQIDDESSLAEAVAQMLGWFRFLRERTAIAPAYDSVPAAIFHVLQTSARQAGLGETDAFNRWYAILKSVPVVDEGADDDEARAEQTAQILRGLESLPRTRAVFIDQCNRLARLHVTLFVSSVGFIGCGPENMAYGDLIALVAGASVPMVLKASCDPSLNSYTVLGPAFVHGIMKGEGWNSNDLKEAVLV